jgi:membrane-bound lytic murein transglycosylase B
MGKYKNSNNRSCKRNKLQEKSPDNEWWDEAFRQAIKQKHTPRMKHLQQKRTANQEHYKEKIKAANKICKKKQVWNKKIMQIDEANKRYERNEGKKRINKRS